MTHPINDPTTSRRDLLAMAGAGGASLLGMAAGTPAAKAGSRPRTFVLVHGAWRGAWIWRRVEQRLTAAGHRVFTPTLTGLGERSHLLSMRPALSMHIADVINTIRWEGLDDITLCGHSYGGLVISGVAEQMSEAIAAIVFLDAFVPADGDTIMTLSSPRIAEAIKAQLAAGDISMPPPPAAIFAVNQADQAYVDRHCTPQPIATFTEAAKVSGAHDRLARKTYIRATGYATPSFDAALARAESDPTWCTHRIPCGHDAMLDLPDLVADLLVQAG